LFPYCEICGGLCSANNRFSSTESNELFCHYCGEATYVSLKEPLCEECAVKEMQNA